MSLLTPFALLGLLAAIPLLLLYMLRLRRREIIVSSNFLWQQIVRDREANTPWQRLRRNILLILQLLILAAVVLALARPAQIVPRISAAKTVILLDASGSMNATDIAGRTRFSEAQRQANIILSQVGSEDSLSVIRVAESAEPLVSYTNDVKALRAAIHAAQPGHGRGDWDTALTLAAAGAEGAEDFRIILISDGGLGETARLPENIPQPAYVPVGEASDNLAISALAARALPGQAPQLFAQVQNYRAVDAEATLLIRLDGELWDSVTETISAQSQRSFIFGVDEAFTTVQAELVLDTDSVTDFLTLDNTAYTVASDTRTRRILLVSDQPNTFLDQILRSLPGVQIFRGDASRLTLPETEYDLYIFNHYLPQRLPDADMLVIDPPASSELFTLGEISDQVGRLRIEDGSHPLTAFLNVNNISLRQFRQITAADWAEPLVMAQEGAVLLAGEDHGRQIMLLMFNLLDSDLPLQIAWPLLMSNALEWFSPANIVSGGTAYQVGDVVRLDPPLDADSVQVTLPDGTSRAMDINGETLSFSETYVPGFYRVNVIASGEIVDTQIIAVNVFGAGESDIAPVSESAIRLGGGAVPAAEAEQFGFREYWPLGAALALLLLLVEWVVYFRRLRVPTEIHSDLRRTTARGN